MRFFTKNNGAVSVFLVIILVPMIVVTSLFVDVARMHLGQAMLDSAGDLAMNTVMTQFDADLNDYYGMLGTCKTGEELKKLSEDFYVKSLSAAGLSEAESKRYASKLAASLGGGESAISDLMNIEPVKDKFSVTTIGDSSFSNPAVVKTQVVNFMKYRSPINGILNLLDGLQKVSEASKNATEEAELISEKEDMCEKEQTLMELLKNLDTRVREYEKCDAGSGMKLANTAGMKQLIRTVNDHRDKMRSYCEEIVLNFLYLNINDIQSFSKKTIKENFNPSNVLSIDEEYEKLDAAISDFNDVRARLETACTVSTGNELRDGVTKGITVPSLYNEYKGKAEAVRKRVVNMEEAYKKLSDEEREEDYPDAVYLQNIGTRMTYKRTYLQFKAQIVTFEHEVNHGWYKKVSDGQVSGVGNTDITELYNSMKNDLNGKLAALAETMKQVKEAVGQAIDCIDKGAVWQEKKGALQQINKIQNNALEEFLEANRTWYEHAVTLKNNGSEIGKADVEMADGTENAGGQISDAQIMNGIKDNVTPANLNRLKQHLSNIKEELNKIKDKLNRLKLGSTSVVGITTVDQVKAKFESRIPRSTYESNLGNTSALKQLANSNFGELYKDPVGALSDAWVDQSGSTPVLSDDPVCKWLHEVFEEKECDENKKKKKDDYKKKSDEKLEQEDEGTGVDGLDEKYESSKRKMDDISSRPSGGAVDGGIAVGEKSKELSKASGTLNSFFSSISGELTRLATGFRDKLYSVDYMMSMLSYDTFVNEGLYDVAEEQGENVSDFTNTMASIRKSSVIGAWSDENVTNPLNKSLTNKIISQEKNYLFGSEVEYILYGKDNETNTKNAHNTIFAVRMGCNAIYAYKEFWKDPVINGVAVSISAATQGILSPAIIKLAIILALVVAESCYDSMCLKAGMPVALLKTDESWHMSIREVFPDEEDLKNASGTGVGHQRFEISLRYSDYLKIFLMVSMMSGNEDKLYLRLADVLQSNMTLITGNDQYTLTNCHTWFSISSAVRVRPLMLDLPWTKDAEGNPKDDTSWYTLHYSRANGYY